MSINEWVDNEDMVYTYSKDSKVLFSLKREVLSDAMNKVTWMKLEDTMLYETSQLQKDQYCMILLIWDI